MISVKTLPSSIVSSDYSENSKERQRWSPYNVNEGSCLAISGRNFAILASDTRMSDGYTILSRSVSKLHSLTPHTILGSAGMQADASSLKSLLNIRIQQYNDRHHQQISTEAIAQMLSNTLYYKRFFPYYTFNVLGGIDKNGNGICYGYDAIGSFEKIPYGVTGSASALITSILDNQIEFKTQKLNKKELNLDEMIDLVKDVFTVAGERDIYTGDEVEIAIITKEGTKWEKFKLKKD